MPAETMVEVWRGEICESRHVGHLAVADGAGRLVLALGDPERVIFMRSSAKPFQTMAVVLSGAADRFNMTSADLAIATASHTGERVHLEQVEHLLSLVGHTAADLQCGACPPLDREVRLELLRDGRGPEAIHSDCSGKHAAMLGVAEILGGDTANYLDPDAPGQKLAREVVAEMCMLRVEDVVVGVDGCSAPVFGVPLRAMAAGYARLAQPDSLRGELRSAAMRVRDAMLMHPYLIAGRNQVGVDIMREGQGRLIAKMGAEAVFGVGDLARGLGLALKLDDGQQRGVAPALIEALVQAGFLDEAQAAALGAWRGGPQRNYGGREVGRVVARFALRATV